ncbi:MAG: class I SAM-dependent methyltransferase [Planctomycetes bacterium]|nr:class I SAM-dependent methyltransferase [Planctomycetota bacterium]
MSEPQPQQSYARCWDEIASDRAEAYRLVDESQSEEALAAHGKTQAKYVVEGLRIGPGDVVLDLGCGVGRIGKEVAPRAGKWVGVDVSANMVALARERMHGLPNVEVRVVSGADLAPIPTASIDKIYCHAVFIHMDKEDFYSYLVEARRVLKPGGLFYFDVWNLCHEVGWLRWQYERALYATRAERPIHRNQFSTPDEVRMMVRMAGLELLSLIETFSLHAVCTHVPPDTDRTAFLEQLRRATGEAYRSIHYGEGDLRFFGGKLVEGLRARGHEPERPPPGR